MKKNIWIWNHYATNTFIDQGGRHYWFAENLLKQGYQPKIFCANTVHNSSNIIKVNSRKYATNSVNCIPYIFVKTNTYSGNGTGRIKNIIEFYKNLFIVSNEYAILNGKPDIILASSVHPLTLVAGIKIAKKFNVPCICEVRDLWPESLVAYNIIKKNNPFLKLLYKGERWIYKKTDALIFTTIGGRDYIIEKCWDEEQGGSIDLAKVHYIDNGIDLKRFNRNAVEFQIKDDDLDNTDIFKVLYTGSIREVNNVSELVEAAKILHKRGNKRIKFLIWGDGNELESLRKKVDEEKLDNICFKGWVKKEYIPFILSKSDLNVYTFRNNSVQRFGSSANKSFEYFASGKPVLTGANSKYSTVDKYKCGVAMDKYDFDSFVDTIVAFSEMSPEQYNQYCENARKAAKDFDYQKLTEDLIRVIEQVK